jgi:hypothetical protein
MNRQNDRMEVLINRLKHGHMCAIPNDVLITVQENVRIAKRMLCASEDMDPTAASIARNAIVSACSALDSYAGMRT